MMVYWFSATPVLNYRANVVPLDGDINKIRTIDQTPDGGPDTQSVYAGRPCATDFFPSKMEWQGPDDPTTIGDFNDTNLLNVSEAAKTLIESLEPGVHQFVPVQYSGKSGRHLENRYFWVVCNRLDSVNRRGTTYVLRKGLSWRPASDLIRRGELDLIPPGLDVKAPPMFVFERAQIGNAHIWRDKHIDIGGPLVSDRFVGAINALGLTGAQFNEAGELA